MSLDEIEKAAAKVIMKQLQDSWHEIRYDEIHNKPYLVGKKTELSTTEAVSILSSKRVMTFEELKDRVGGPGYSSVLLGIRDSDSTIVYYNSQIGLNSPVEEEMNAATGSDGSSVEEEMNAATGSEESSVEEEMNATTESDESSEA